MHAFHSSRSRKKKKDSNYEAMDSNYFWILKQSKKRVVMRGMVQAAC